MTAQDILTPPQKYRLKVADYLRLHEAGAFEGVRTELIEGDIIVMSPQARRHMFMKNELAYRLRRALQPLGSGLFVGTEGSVEIDGENLPEPDILLTDAPDGEGFIPSSSIALLVEIAVTSQTHDINRKANLYARHGIPEYWVVDVKAETIHLMSAPVGQAYSSQSDMRFGERITAATIAGLAVETSGL